MPDKILIVEDDDLARDLLVQNMEREGYLAVEARDGLEALSTIEGENPDLIILDLVLPKLDGIDVCKRARTSTTAPIIMVTARTDEIDRILGLEIGADDYVTKPYSMRELVARVRAHLRRSGEFAQPTAISTDIHIGPITIVPTRREVRLNEDVIYMTPKEFDLLWVLVTNLDQVITRDELLRAVWGYDGIETRTLDVHVGRLRSKLEEDPRQPKMILTARSVGYRFAPPES